MDPEMLQNVYNQQDPKKTEEQRKKQLEAEEKRKIMLQSIMTNEARERCKIIYYIYIIYII
jgi:DNA-binding TFAR19-related protein (PDSD5 family)